jgi:hypothetical protein
MFKGVKTRFPLLLPILSSGEAVKRIVRAVLKNRKRIIMPRFVYSTLLVRLLPPGGIDCLADFFGISSAMDDFTGRETPKPPARKTQQKANVPARKAPETPARKPPKPAARKAPETPAKRGTNAKPGKAAAVSRKPPAKKTGGKK